MNERAVNSAGFRKPDSGRTCFARRALLRRSALLGVLSGAIAGIPGCERPAPTACDGLGDRLYGITRAEYAPCAREIMATLDTLQRQLQRLILRRDSLAEPEAGTAYRHLRLLLKRAGFTSDHWREMRAQSRGPRTERWPDEAMRAFNLHVGNASAQYMSALGRPNQANLKEGSRHHRYARQAYARIR